MLTPSPHIIPSTPISTSVNADAQPRGFVTDVCRLVRCACGAWAHAQKKWVPYRATTPGGFSTIEAFKKPLKSHEGGWTCYSTDFSETLMVSPWIRFLPLACRGW